MDARDVTTRANIEAILVQRAGAWMTSASLPVTIVGSNAALNDPIGYAIRTAGGTVAAPALVTDADVATVTNADLDLLLDVAELRTLESVLANYALVDGKAGPVEAKASQLADRLERRIATLRAWLAQAYGIGGVTRLTSGVITLDITE